MQIKDVIKDELLKRIQGLGAEDILTGDAIRERSFNGTVAQQVDTATLVYLTKNYQIKQLVELSIKNNYIIQPISSGKNWGYGSISLSEELKTRELIILDLSRMNKITEVDKSLGLIKLEPGVTQQQLYEYLETKGWDYMTPVTGAGPTCSILSNALERGFGITKSTDHFYALNRMSVIVPNPELWNCSDKQENVTDDQFVMRSVINELDHDGVNSFVASTFKWDIGPYLDGLFTQSGLGIVTDATFSLAPKPQYASCFYIKVYNDNKLESCVELINSLLKQFEGPIAAINLMDKRRVLSMVAANPDPAKGHKCMSDAEVEDLAIKNDVPAWMLVGSIQGNKQVVRAIKRTIKKKAKFAEQVLFSDSLILSSALWLAKNTKDSCWGPFLRFKKQLHSLQEGIDITKGIPRQVALPLAYWRNSDSDGDKSNTLNPDRDKCGLLWYPPLIPMKAEKIKEFVEFVRTETKAKEIEPLITFTNLRYDCIDATVPILYDNTNDTATEQAKECLNNLFDRGLEKGFVPYRLNVKQQAELNGQSPHWKVLKVIKATMDPHNILCPGRYNPG